MSDKFNSYRYKTQPYEHQKKVLKDSWAELYYAYLLEMGTGKSKCAIDNIGMLYEDNKINAVLIIAPRVKPAPSKKPDIAVLALINLIRVDIVIKCTAERGDGHHHPA